MGKRIFRRAREAPVVRVDVTADDLVPLMCGIVYAVSVLAALAARAKTACRCLAALPVGVLVDRVAPWSTGAGG